MNVGCIDGVALFSVLCSLSLPIFPLSALLVEKLKVKTNVSEAVSTLRVQFEILLMNYGKIQFMMLSNSS